MIRSFSVLLLALLAPPQGTQAAQWRQTQADDYTRYELLDPESQSFRIYYDVSATTPGARYFFNGLREGSEHRVTEVIDRMTGKRLQWKIVSAAQAAASGVANLRPQGHYLQVDLAREVPQGGESRIRIDKTYRDPKSYFRQGDTIVFARSLGIKRNSLILPAGYEVVACNYPSQVALEPDGRLKVSFFNRGPSPVDFRVSARLRKPASGDRQVAGSGPPAETASTTRRVNSGARSGYRFPERAFQDREIVYFLQQPETHSFRLYHDYTETRPGVDRYLNLVRPGSRASNPSARLLDTGQQLKVETLRGKQAIQERGLEMPEAQDDTEVVVIWFDPVQPGHSVRLRIEETYTDPSRYLLSGEDLIWDRAFGRPQNAVLLPQGWYLTASAVPAVISEESGKIRLDFVNDRPGNLEVFIKARRR
ncbi:MAG: hypothetical protein V3T83_08180 [Acidobacteriota bacterium]